MGLKTVLVEKARLGGECLIAGCIPSKSIISVAKAYDKVREGAKFGIHAENISIDFTALQAWKAGVVRSLETGVATLCQGYKVEVIKGEAELTDPNKVVVKTEGGTEEISTKNIVIATGSTSISLPGLEFDGKTIVSSREALELDRLPKRMLIVGGGYIGLEIAGMYQRLGSQITVVELMDQLLPGTETDLVRYVQKSLERRGAAIHLKSKVLSVEKTGEGARARSRPPGRGRGRHGHRLGKRGKTPRHARPESGQDRRRGRSKGYIRSDQQMRTNVRNVFAIGDVRGMPLLAHKAQKEGIVAAESASGLPTVAEWKAIPWAIFTDPESQGSGSPRSRRWRRVSGQAVEVPVLGPREGHRRGETDGFVRIISDTTTRVVLGVQIVGPRLRT